MASVPSFRCLVFSFIPLAPFRFTLFSPRYRHEIIADYTAFVRLFFLPPPQFSRFLPRYRSLEVIAPIICSFVA